MRNQSARLNELEARNAALEHELARYRDAAERTRRSEERLRLVHDATGLADFEAGPDRLVHISDAFRQQAGLAPEVDTLSMSEWFTIVHPDDRAQLLETIKGSLAEGDIFDGEYRIVRQDTGEVRWISTHTKVERDEAGAPIRSIGAHLDITERKLAE